MQICERRILFAQLTVVKRDDRVPGRLGYIDVLAQVFFEIGVIILPHGEMAVSATRKCPESKPPRVSVRPHYKMHCLSAGFLQNTFR